jgi:phosphatidylinositol alpha-1,6-mannosyltransferase
VVDGETGVLVDGRNVEQVADAVSALLEDPALAEHMGKAGRDRVEGFYTWPRAAAQLGRWLREAEA